MSATPDFRISVTLHNQMPHSVQVPLDRSRARASLSNWRGQSWAIIDYKACLDYTDFAFQQLACIYVLKNHYEKPFFAYHTAIQTISTSFRFRWRASTRRRLNAAKPPRTKHHSFPIAPNTTSKQHFLGHLNSLSNSDCSPPLLCS